MNIVLAIDSYKGCLSSVSIERIVADALCEASCDVKVDLIPIADGGEGTLPVISEMLHATPVSCIAHNPCMKLISCQYSIVLYSHTAIIEMAAVSGLPLIDEDHRNPMLTTTYGTGELIIDAWTKGCTDFIIGIGGSATNDCGVGMLQALGYRFYDRNGALLGQGGGMLGLIHHWDDSLVPAGLKECRFIVACDVTNPLYGADGGAFIFAPQKGATPAMVRLLDDGMRHFSEMIKQNLQVDISAISGSGAAGGMGGGMIAFLGASLISGADLVLQLSQFEQRIAYADWVITGEGKMDAQTLMGKIPGKVLQLGLKHKIPVIGLAGCIEDETVLIRAGFTHLYAITPEGMPLNEAIQPDIAEYHLKCAVGRFPFWG